MNVTPSGGGASWQKTGSSLVVTINPAGGPATLVRYLLVSEMVEQFMRAQGRGWFGQGTEGSQGEGLSRFLGAHFLAVGGLGGVPAGFANSDVWLISSRADFVNDIRGTDDGPDDVTGCALLFIYYLFAQLGFSVEAIVAAGAATLAGVYANLTGDSIDPFPDFKQVVDDRYPPGNPATIGGANPDNPFPLPSPRVLSTMRFICWLPTPNRTGSVRRLIAGNGQATLRPTVNTRRRPALA